MDGPASPGGRRRRATIEDVASHARVSRAAVSKVLRGAAGVSPQMHDRVTESIDALSYRPRVSARGMRGRTFTIGLTINDPANGFIAEIVAGALAELEGTGYRLIIAVAEGTAPTAPAIENLYDRQVDGIIAVTPSTGPDDLDRLAREVPLVQLGLHLRSAHHDSVNGDDEHGAAVVMEHLLALGHRRIAFAGHVDPFWITRPDRPHVIRERVYREAMRAAGLEEEIAVIPGRFEEIATYSAASAAFAAGLRPTAVFAGNDDAALGVIRAAAEHEDLARLAVAGYDAARIGANPRIGLTTVDQDGRRMGSEAARMLLERIAGRDAARSLVVPTRLIVRTSTFPPPA